MKSKLVVTTTLLTTIVLGIFLILPQNALAQTGPSGPWLDSMVWQEQPNSAIGLEQVKIEEGDFFMFTLVTAGEKNDAKASPLVQTFSTFGSVDGLLLNPNAQQATLPWNPFSDTKIREAMQWLIDRSFVGDEIYGGFSARFVSPFHPKTADYFREIEVNTMVEDDYVGDFNKGKGIIETQMAANGATIGTSGFWEDSTGKIIDIQIIARIEDLRFDIGNYVAEQLRAIGFKVTVNPSPSSDAIPLVYGGAPDIGAWHIYTEGWAFTANVGWDDGQLWVFHNCVFEPFCARFGAPGTYNPPADFDTKSTTLAFGQYTSLAERQTLIKELVPRSLNETNYRMWLHAEEAVFPVSNRVDSFTFDVLAGPWSQFSLKSVRLHGTEEGVRPDGSGGQLNVLNFIMFNDGWNPWTAPGWLYDGIQRGIMGDPGMFLHPQTGLWMDVRVTTNVTTAGPTGNITLPSTAMTWNITAEAFEPVAPGTTAVSKVRSTFANDGKWHTGQDITVDDHVYALSEAFRRAFGDVRVHDDRAATQGTQTYLRDIFKGCEVVDDTTIDVYIDFWHVDNQEIAAAGYSYPADGQAPVPWEISEIAIQTVLNDDTRIHERTATADGLPWLDMGRNPDSIAALDTAYTQLSGANQIPLGMSDWITPEEAAARYAAAKAFRDANGHWYASNGPFVLKSIKADIRQSLFDAFRDGYPFTANKWDFLTTVELPEVAYGTFPTAILAGAGATLDFTVKQAGNLTDPADVAWSVRELATGDVALAGSPVRTALGTFEVQLSPRLSNQLVTGSFELLVKVSGEARSTVATFGFIVQSQLDFFQALFQDVQDRLDTLGDTTSGLGSDVAGVQSSTNSLTNLVTAVLALAVIAIVVSVLLLVLLLRRLPARGME